MAINFYSDIHLAANKIGRDADNLLDFSTDNEITFRVGAGDGVVFKASGEIEATKFDGALEGNADTATALATTRAFQTNLASTSSANFDGSAANTHGVTGTLAVGNGGTGVTSMTNLKNALDDETWTFANNVTLAGFVLDGNTITGVDDSSEFTDDDAHIMTSAAINDRFAQINADTTGTATVATTVTVTDNENTNEENLITFVAGAADSTGNHGLEMDGNLTYNPSTNGITATRFTGNLVGTASVATTVTITDNENTNEENAVVFTAGGDVDGGNLGLESDGDLTYNPSTGTLSSTIFKGNIDAVDGDFDGTLEADAITVGGTALNTVIAGVTVTNATNSAHVLVTDNESTNEENQITFIEGAGGGGANRGLEADGDLTYNPSTGTVSATIFKGNIDAVDGDFDGTLEADAITVNGSDIAEIYSPIAGGEGIVATGVIAEGEWRATDIGVQHGGTGVSTLTSNAVLVGNGTSAITSSANLSFDDTDVTLAGAGKINFRDTNSYINSPTANDLEIVCTDLVIDTSNSIAIETSDLTMYDPVNGGNPTLSIGSSATNRFEIKTAYNSSAQTIDEVYFSTYTTSSSTNDGRYIFEVDEVELVRFLDAGLSVTGNCYLTDADARYTATDTTASSSTQGGRIQLNSNDGAAMGSGHRLGAVEFKGAEDASSTMTIGARIEAITDAAWSASENGADLVFYTTDGNASESEVMRATASTGVSIPKRKFTPTGSNTAGTVTGGDIGYFGSATVVAGKIYHYKSDGSWELSDPNSAATSDGLLGVALDGGTASDVGMLLRGMVTIDHDPGAIGDLLYLAADTTGTASSTAPSGSGDIVRTIGYQVNHASNGEIWFNPSTDYITLA